MKCSAIVIAACLTSLAAGRAQAAGPWDERHYALALHTGLGTPFGTTGVSAEVSPLPWLVGEFGGGPANGGQTAAGIRLRWTRGMLAVGGQVGVSWGAFEWRPVTLSDTATTIVSDQAFWLNMDASLALLFDFGLVLRFYFGASRVLNPDDLRCSRGDVENGDCTRDTRPKVGLFPYTGIAFGWAF